MIFLMDMFFNCCVLWWFNFIGYLLELWLKLCCDLVEFVVLFKVGVLVCYVIECDGLFDVLIFECVCCEVGLFLLMQLLFGICWCCLVFVLGCSDGLFWGCNCQCLFKDMLGQFVCVLEDDFDCDVQIVLVLIYVGCVFSCDIGWFCVLFLENWVMVGYFCWLLVLLFNGCDMVVQFFVLVLLCEVLVEVGVVLLECFVCKIVCVLCVYFCCICVVVIGLDFLYKCIVVDVVFNVELVCVVIVVIVSKEKIIYVKVWCCVQKIMLEIVVDYLYLVVCLVLFVLFNFWNKLYDGIVMYYFDKVCVVVLGYEVVYVFSYCSYVDYLLMSYQLYYFGVVVLYIVVGVNFNLLVIGLILCCGGVFFLCCSFKGNVLYFVVFNEYVVQLIDCGVLMEYFIEGGCLCIGCLLVLCVGMLVMIVCVFLCVLCWLVLFQLVYIGYEKLMEGKFYVGELFGKLKEKELLIGLIKGFKVLCQCYGYVVFNFGELIELILLFDVVSV